MPNDIARLISALAQSTGQSSDFDLNPNVARPAGGVLRQAGVLVPVWLHEGQARLILTKRSSHLKHHPGQIAFPGGRIDPDDADAVAAALREAEEEVALPRHQVELLGTLDPYETGTGYAITPVVGLVPSGLAFTPQASEVADVFHVPFAHVMDPANHEVRSGEWQGRERRFYVIRHGNHEIWGATAGILVNLSRRLA